MDTNANRSIHIRNPGFTKLGTEENTMKKVYVDVIAENIHEGLLRPLSIRWKNGRQYNINKIIKCTAAGKTVKDSFGLLYTCDISGKEIRLYYEDSGFGGKWFVEARSC